MLLYIEYLENVSHLMNFLNFMFKKMPRSSQMGAAFVLDYFVEKFPSLFRTHIVILKNLPLIGTHAIRKEILSHVKQELNDVMTQEKQDRIELAKNPNI